MTKLTPDQQRTLSVYENYPDIFEQKFAEHFEMKVKEYAQELTSHLTKNSRILDLGAGPGTHSLFFKKQGFTTLCVDISPEMVKRCRQKKLEAIQADFENLPDSIGVFDAIWMYASLLHVPKERVATVLQSAFSHLRPNGLFALAVMEGSEEGFRAGDEEKYGARRWFSYFSDSEVRALLKPYGKITSQHSNSVENKYTFLHYLLIKTPLISS